MIEARHTGGAEGETDRGIWEWRRWRRGWNRSFYMLSGFNLVRAIILQFTEVANQMSVCICALGVCVSFVYPNLPKCWELRLCSCCNHLTLIFVFAFFFFFLAIYRNNQKYWEFCFSVHHDTTLLYYTTIVSALTAHSLTCFNLQKVVAPSWGKLENCLL